MEGLAGNIRSSDARRWHNPPHSEEDPGTRPRASGEGGRGSRRVAGVDHARSSPAEAEGRGSLRSTDLDRRVVVFAHSSRLEGQRAAGSSAIATPSAGAAAEEVEVPGRSEEALNSRSRLGGAAARIRSRRAAGVPDIQAGGRIRCWGPALAGATPAAGTSEAVVTGHRREEAGTGCGVIRPPYSVGEEGTGIAATRPLRDIPGFDRAGSYLLL